jgi:hypothetical protein
MPSTSAASLANNINNTVSATSVSSLLPSPRDLFTLPFRALNQAETFAFSTVPRHIARLTGLNDISVSFWSGGPHAIGETGLRGDAMAAANTAGEGVAQAVGYGDSWYVAELTQTMRKVGGFFAYLTSIWSFACLVEVSTNPEYLDLRALLRISRPWF